MNNNKNTKMSKVKFSSRLWGFLLVLVCIIGGLLYFQQTVAKDAALKQEDNAQYGLKKQQIQQNYAKDAALKQDDNAQYVLKKQQIQQRYAGLPKSAMGGFRRAVNHYISGLDNSSRSFTYVVFSDPQVGLYDMMHGGDGSRWEHDIKNMEWLSVAISLLKTKPDFVFCTGDLNNAFPLTEPGFDYKGFKSRYSPQQTKDLKRALRKYFNNGIPMFTVPGNHDLSENVMLKHMKLYERTWGQAYFYLWNAGRVFIALETQLFRSNNPETITLQNKQRKWLQKLFASLPKDVPKTVFQHVPLFLRDVNEPKGGDTLPLKFRRELLRMFCQNNVNIVFSGHTHVAALPQPYKCTGDSGREVRQVVLTSIVTPFRRGKPSYTVANVDANGVTSFKVFKLNVA